ncbi:MAG TPA: hypothetical protein VD996_08410 [Chitinophagaceae bacterium]|nr:hypothetical protein [Chitinophagaceae bacterium]
MKLSVLGSSTSACTGPTSYANCFLGKLETYYANMRTPITIHNLAIGGYNVYKGMPSSYTPDPGFNIYPDPARNITAALQNNPAVVLVNYPTNNYDTMAVGRVLYALRVIRDSAEAKGKVAFITTTQPRTGFSAAARAKLKELRDSILLQHGHLPLISGMVSPMQPAQFYPPMTREMVFT